MSYRLVWRILRVVVVIGAIAGAVYWLKFSPVPVVGYAAQQGEIVAEVMGTGTMEARVKSTISPKIAGRIQSIQVDQGDRVNRGQLLFTLDDSELAQQVEIAQATILAAQSAVDRLEADRAQSAAVLEQAQRQQDRTTQLLASNAVSVEESDKATEALRVAEAGTARSAAALIEGERQLHAAEKTLAYHQARLADTQVSAPFAGLIVRRFRDPGDIVVPGSPTLTLISTDELWITAWVDETQMAALRVGQPARVVFRSEPARDFVGEVARVGRETDRETREFVVDVRVTSLPDNWAVGQRAEVYIETDRKSSALIVPAAFIHWQDDQPGVFTRHHGTAQWREVQLGLRARDVVEVTAGLEVGEVVLAARTAKSPLVPGRSVELP